MIRFTKQQILMIHTQLIVSSGGTDGLRDEGMLDSAINTPFQMFSGAMLYPTVEEQGARLGYGLIQNHPFVDGNKRIGAHVMLLFLAVNGIQLTYTQQELIDIILNVASGKVTYDELLVWICERKIMK